MEVWHVGTEIFAVVDRVAPQRRDGDPRRTARPRAGDPFRRLRGEPPVDTASLEDTRTWIDVYAEMLGFWQHVAVQMSLWLEEVASEHARRELRDVDQRLIEDRCERVRRRLRLWELRARELDGGETEEASPGPTSQGAVPACR
jgi:hypothetical protein